MLAAAPIGPVLVVVLQKTLRYGRWSGVATGCGAAVVDTAYAAAGLFALSLVRGFVSEHEAALLIAGGCILLLVGFFMSRGEKKPLSLEEENQTRFTNAGFAVQACGCALSNPGAIALMFTYLAVAGLQADTLEAPVWAVLLCVAAGEMLWWTIVTGAVSRFVHITPRTLERSSRIAGVAVIAIGAALAVKGLIMILR